jgi:putative ATP-binding cassette transporter
VAVLVGLFSGLGSTVLLAMLNRAVSETPAKSLNTLFLFLAICILISVARLVSQYLIDRAGQTAVLDLRMHLGRKILATPLRQLEKVGAAGLLTILSNDVNTVSNSIIIFPILCINAALVIGGLIYLATLSLPLFWILLAAIVLGGATYQLPMAAGARRFGVARKEQESLFEYFRGLVNGTKELKINDRRQRDFLARFRESANRQRSVQISANLIYGAAGAWGHLLFFIVVALLVFVRPYFTSVPQETMVGFTLVLLYLMTPLQSFLGMLGQLGQSSAALRRIGELGLSLETLPAGGAPAEVPVLEENAPWQELRLDGVSHQFSDESEKSLFTLGPLDLRFKGGELVFIVGGNGSGKTTLAKLLLGLYSPATGTVYLNSEPITDETREFYQQNFSAVFSDFYLFDQLFGHRNLESDEEARRYLQELRLEHVVAVKDGKFSNINVSRGQQKRLALLSAYLEDRPVYLFDEWAADQDPTFKRIFYLEILPELKRRGKTVLVITHDDQYYDVADRIIKLDEGKVKFDGPASQLPLYQVAASVEERPHPI